MLLAVAAAPARGQAAGGGFFAVSGRRVTVRYTAGDSLVAARYLVFLDGQRPLPGLPDSVPTGVTAWLAPDAAAFDSLVGGQPPEWSAGVAVPSRNALVVPLEGGDLTRPGEAARVLRHEWAHLGLHQYLDDLRVPRWFDEGYAEWSAGWDAGEAWRLRIMLAAGTTPSLDSLTFRWPGGAADARMAYLLSATVLEYLMAASGERGLEVFLRRWRDRGSFEEALRATYGVTSGQLEEDWRGFVKRRYGWTYVVSHSAVFWAFLSVVLLVMVWMRRRERRRRMEKLRAEEPPDRPAFWLGEEEVESGGEPGEGDGINR